MHHAHSYIQFVLQIRKDIFSEAIRFPITHFHKFFILQSACCSKSTSSPRERVGTVFVSHQASSVNYIFNKIIESLVNDWASQWGTKSRCITESWNNPEHVIKGCNRTKYITIVLQQWLFNFPTFVLQGVGAVYLHQISVQSPFKVSPSENFVIQH